MRLPGNAAGKQHFRAKKPSDMNPRPERLFRYFPPHRSDFFAKRQLWFSALKAYNDPFDALPQFETLVESQMERTVKKEFAFLPPEVNCDWRTYKREVIPGAPAFNAWLSLEMAGTLRELVSKDFRLVCFSEKLDDLLMWGHYGRGHTGFVVEFDPKHQTFATEEFGQVHYPETDERPRVEDRDQSKEELWKMVFRKSPEWAYEKEWRLVKLASSLDDNQFVKLPTQLIVAVYFGWQMLPTDRDKLLDSLTSVDWKDVKKFVMCPAPAKYAIRPVPLEEWVNQRREYDEFRIAVASEIQTRTQSRP